MPKALKHQYKYRCEEIGCRKIIRSNFSTEAAVTYPNHTANSVNQDDPVDLEGDAESIEVNSDDEVADDTKEEEQLSKWRLYNYLSPLQACYHLTGYPHLLRLYWILVTLPVTSCSAERALSRLRIIKNRLRSSMSDDWMNALMIIASEQDLMSRINNDTIVDKFASFSNVLKEQLVHV